MPVQQPDIDSEIAYILQYWIQNSHQLITGTIGQNVVWNLAQFIKKNPENWEKATVITDPIINYTTQSKECIIIFTNNSSGSIDFGDNIWNKWYFINATSNTRTIAGGKFYYDINGDAQTSIPARSVLHIAKGEDDFWYQTNGSSGNVVAINFIPLSFEIGQPDSPMNDGDTVLVIPVNNAIQDSEFVTLDSGFIAPDLSGQISYGIVYTLSDITITFNQAVSDGQKYYIKYATL